MNESRSNPLGEVPGVERGLTHGLPSVSVQTPAGSGLVFLQGAHVAAWVPAGHTPVIWLSSRAVYQPGKALRGGVPICFPWFGAHAEHKEYPQHGFARTTPFEYLGARLDSSGRAELEFALGSSEATRALFPHEFRARLRVAFGATLSMAFSVTNNGSERFDFEEALHSYFHVADVRRAAVTGLQGAIYHDKVRALSGLAESAPELRLEGETDRVYQSAASCTIQDPAGKRALQIQKSSSASTVVWNPWAEKAAQMSDFSADAWPEMLCVESANVATSRITLAPGNTHTLSVTVSVASTG
jgi:glucose-6-phosphate 1-epimerase